MSAPESTFAAVLEQEEAKRLLTAALGEGPAHAYLFHGPGGVGKRTTALALAAGLLGDAARVEHRTHPDLYVLEPLGDQIRIDAIRSLRRDLHMRPFEGHRRVYLVLGADLMNEEAADALLKDLEEPPSYAVIVLVADELGPLPDTIRSRCQLVGFRRLSRRAVESFVTGRRPDLAGEELAAVVRMAAGRLDRASRLIDPEAAAQREALIQVARSVYLDERFDSRAAAHVVVDLGRAAGARVRDEIGEAREGESARELEQRARRIARGAEREDIAASLELLAGWYRDVLAAGAGAQAAALNADRLAELREDAGRVGIDAAGRAVEAVAETRRRFDLNVHAPLALEALFLVLRRELVRAAAPVA